jgi:hypothetical protein
MLSDVHRFVFQSGSREAVQSWAHHIEQLQLNHQWYGKQRILLLMDARNAAELPLRYLFEMISDYNRAYPDLQAPGLVLAYLHHPSALILDLYRVLAEMLTPPVRIEFFTDESAARAWLQKMM